MIPLNGTKTDKVNNNIEKEGEKDRKKWTWCAKTKQDPEKVNKKEDQWDKTEMRKKRPTSW